MSLQPTIKKEIANWLFLLGWSFTLFWLWKWNLILGGISTGLSIIFFSLLIYMESKEKEP